MKIAPFSSHLSKRLTVALAMLLPLVSIYLVGEEPSNRLASEKHSKIFGENRPQLELIKARVILPISEWTPEISIDFSSSPSLTIDCVSISLLSDDTYSRKSSPFREKKSINFSREIAKNEQEKLTSAFSEQEKDPLLANPDLENRSFQKHDFLSEKFILDMESEKLKGSTPFAFEESEDKSSLINRKFSHKKNTPNINQPHENIKTAKPSAKNVVAHEKKEEVFSPVKEMLSKHCFHVDQDFFSVDYSFAGTELFTFESRKSFEENFFLTTFSSTKKGIFPKRKDFSDQYFKNHQMQDFSGSYQEVIVKAFTPTRENIAPLVMKESTEILLSLHELKSLPILFEKHSIALNIPYASYHAEKQKRLSLSNNFSSFCELPYLSAKSITNESIKSDFIPTKEKATPIPPKYLVSKGPTIALELSDQIVSFALTPEFELFMDEKTIELPKKAQEFQTSALAILEPYLDQKKEVLQNNQTLTPSPESHQSLALNKKGHQLELSEPSALTETFGFKNDLESSLPIISHSIEFPHHKTEKQATDFPIEGKVYLDTLFDENEHIALCQPTLESLPPSSFEKSFELDTSNPKVHENFHLSQNEELEIPSQTQLERPKKEFSHSFSQLAIQRKEIPYREEAFGMPQTEKSYSPSLQKLKTPLNETALYLSLPQEQKSTLPFEYPNERGEIALFESEEQIDKFETFNAGSLGRLELALPNVKEKDIAPKTDRHKAEKLAQDIPDIEKMDQLIARGGKKFSVNKPAETAAPSHEEETLVKLDHRFHRPNLPAYFPPEGLDPFQFETSYSAIKEEQLDHIKKKMIPTEDSVEDLILPYVAGKKVIPNKAQISPKNALEDLPNVEKVIELAARDENFPNTRNLLEKEPLPVYIKNTLSIDAAEITTVETGMIHSQAKEIIEDYDQENRYSYDLIALEFPSLEMGPKEAEVKSLNQSNRFTNGFLSEVPPPSHLQTATYSNEFDTEVHYSKREDGKGYYFAIKLKPGEKLNFASPSQNFIFVVDGSSSIQKHRYGVFKEGVARALTYLSEGDSFNIVVADSKMRSFSETYTDWSKGSLAKAKQFLMDQNYRGFFVNYDAFDLISKVAAYFSPERENIVVLITDGHSFNTLKEHKEDFKQLSQANMGKFSIFTATASQGNNLSMLDLLSTFNNGELMYSKTNASFSRQLSVLVKHIESFVAKNIHINVTGKGLETGIEFYPNEKTLPSLYADRPYMIYGSIDELKDFDIILQGRAGDQWINIKQSISFKHAVAASHSIKKGMALQKAYVCYDYFMKNDDSFFLSEAEKILEAFNISTAMR